MKMTDDELYAEATDHAMQVIRAFGENDFDKNTRRNIIIELRAAYIHGYQMATQDNS